jgi:universal stress protein A
MDRIKTILAPTDLSDFSLAGVRYALELAASLGAEATVYHAIEVEELMRHSTLGLLDNLVEKSDDALRRFLEVHCADLTPRAKVRTKVELGAPDTNIVEEAKKSGADLIVISTHGRTGLSHILVGSVTEKVVRHAGCPVLSIRPESRKAPSTTATAA